MLILKEENILISIIIIRKKKYMKIKIIQYVQIKLKIKINIFLIQQIIQIQKAILKMMKILEIDSLKECLIIQEIAIHF